MARRGGKAASRRERQRRAQRQVQPRPTPPRPTAATLNEAVDAVAEERVVQERVVQGRVAAAPVAPAAPLTKGARHDPRFAVSGPSRLGERAAAEYHYVRSDLRNIGMLVVMMGIALGIAVFAFNALGIGPT